MPALPFKVALLQLRPGKRGAVVDQFILNLDIPSRPFNTDSLRVSIHEKTGVLVEEPVDVLQ